MDKKPPMQQVDHPAHNMPPANWRELSTGPDGNLRESSNDPKPTPPPAPDSPIGNTPFQAIMKGLGGN